MDYYFILLLLLFGLPAIVLFYIDAKYQPKKNSVGKFEMRIGYSAYFQIVVIAVILIVIIIGLIASITENIVDEMFPFYVALCILSFGMLFYRILEVQNDKVIFDEESIVRSNFLNKKTSILFEEIDTIKYSFFGFGNDLIFKDINGKELTVHAALNGFKTFEEYLKKRTLL